ncbi:Gag Pol protein [Plakobranchus ocellatus]|uniref:Gag Pol protein n=1 Tax=Plakobranchus ocellatus TaxID=259542 RepID=A0AAV3ZD50_9GAST|nr:Gag Pol protein [Plakobranchus ocellatus]
MSSSTRVVFSSLVDVFGRPDFGSSPRLDKVSRHRHYLLPNQPVTIDALQPGGHINAFSIKLPEVWFARVEAQFGTKNITQDQTRYDYVVSAIDVRTAEEVQDVLVNPPGADRYATLKNALIRAFGKSQAQRDSELLKSNGLGDKKPTALLCKINALNDDPQTLKKALFLSNLTDDVRSILAVQEFSDFEKLAELLIGFGKRVVRPSNTSHRLLMILLLPRLKLSQNQRYNPNVARDQEHSQQCAFTTKNSAPHASNCQPGCKFSTILSNSSGNDNASR